MATRLGHFLGWCTAVSLLAGYRTALAGAVSEAVAAVCTMDQPFPEFLHLWSERWALRNSEGDALPYARTNMPLGAYLQAYVHNDSTNSLAINTVKLQGVDLNAAIVFSDHFAGGMHPASLLFSKLPQSDRDRLMAAGEPVWWKVDPLELRPGGYAEITIRLRRSPKPEKLALQVVANNRSWEAEASTTRSPRFAGLAFGPELDTIYGYLGHPRSPAPALERLMIDNDDVTKCTTTGADPAVELTPFVVRLNRRLERASFHCFRAFYEDGSAAITAVRAMSDELVYGMWGYINQGKTPGERVDYFLGDLRRHNINAVMESYGGEVADFLSGEAGLRHSREIGIRAMRNKPGRVLNPLYYFIKDEPDAHDFAARELEPAQRLGVLGQAAVQRSYDLRRQDAATPQLLNLDNTYKPENWYTYAQIADVCSADPYFQEQQRIVWNERPAWTASFLKPDYVLGAATICASACAPKPLHIILNAVRHDSPEGQFRYATPEEKAVELFYALGAGAKGFSYWWYTPYGEFHGCGAQDKEATALWRQIGRLGAQVRTAGPVLTRSCPAKVPLKAPAKLWTRTLLAGTDALALLVVNDNIASDRLGTVVVPLPRATVTLNPPSWLKASDAFEITPQGVTNIQWTLKAGEIVLELGKTEVARMIMITGQPELRTELQHLYDQRFAATAGYLRGRFGEQ